MLSLRSSTARRASDCPKYDDIPIAMVACNFMMNNKATKSMMMHLLILLSCVLSILFSLRGHGS